MWGGRYWGTSYWGARYWGKAGAAVAVPVTPAGATGPLVLFRIFADLDMTTNIQNFSNVTVRHPSRTYEGRVLAFGSIDRSIPQPSGLCQTGEASVKLADTDQALRRLAAPGGSSGSGTLIGRLCEIRMGNANTSEAAFETAYVGEIRGVTFGPGTATVQLRDIHQRWLDHLIPPLISRVRVSSSGMPEADSSGTSDLIPFPNLPPGTDSVFAPFIFGPCRSSDDNPQGVIPLQLVDTTLNRYIVARHFCWGVPAVYRQLSGDELFSLVDDSEYAITQEVVATLDGVEYTFTFLDFMEDQAGAEIRADVDGCDNRQEFGPLPAISGTALLTNPVDWIMLLVYYATLHSPAVARYAIDVDAWLDVRDKCFALGYQGAGGFFESITWRAALTQILTSFGIDFYQTKRAQLALGLTVDSDPDRPVFTDIRHILKDSTEQKLADPAFNRIRYRFAENYATGQWGQSATHNNPDDHEAIGEIQETALDLHFVRDAPVAAAVILDRSGWLDLQAFQFECQLPAPEVLADLELAKLIGITHYGGIAVGGYDNEEFKVFGLTLDLDHLTMRLRGIRRVPECSPLAPTGDARERTFIFIVD